MNSKSPLNPIGPDTVIEYHRAVDSAFEGWAEECRWNPTELRRASETAIRERHSQAVIEHETHRAHGRQPDIFQLDLGSSVQVIYTVEPHGVVIRGYCHEIQGEPRDDFDGGGFYSEYEWSLPPDEQLPPDAKEEP